jgi:phenylalanyl-tRNA synthetase beta chain
MAEPGPVERRALGIAATGDFAGRNWTHPGEDFGFFHLKGAVGALLRGLRSERWDLVAEGGLPWLDPSSAAVLVVGGQLLGALGRLHPSLEEDLKLRQPVYVAEVDFDALARHLGQPVAARPLPRHPAVERDLSVVVSPDVPYAAIRDGIAGLTIPELAGLELIDVYEGAGIPQGKVGLTLRLTFQDRLRTLTVDQVQTFSDNVVTFLRDSFGAELR